MSFRTGRGTGTGTVYQTGSEIRDLSQVLVGRGASKSRVRWDNSQKRREGVWLIQFEGESERREESLSNIIGRGCCCFLFCPGRVVVGLRDKVHG
jgi:hypothetical protein